MSADAARGTSALSKQAATEDGVSTKLAKDTQMFARVILFFELLCSLFAFFAVNFGGSVSHPESRHLILRTMFVHHFARSGVCWAGKEHEY